MMADSLTGDGLSSISIENLTAAVTSLFQRPLPDMQVLPSSNLSNTAQIQQPASLYAYNSPAGMQPAGNQRNLANSEHRFNGNFLVGDTNNSVASFTQVNHGNTLASNSSTNLQTLSTSCLESLLRSVGIQPVQGTNTTAASAQQPLPPLPRLQAFGNQQPLGSLSQLLPAAGAIPVAAVGPGGNNQAGNQSYMPVNNGQGLVLSNVKIVKSKVGNRAASKFVKVLPKPAPVNILPRPDTTNMVVPPNIQLLSSQGPLKFGSLISAPDLTTQLDGSLLNNANLSVLNIEKSLNTTGVPTLLDLQALQAIVQNQLNLCNKEIGAKLQNTVPNIVDTGLSSLLPPMSTPLTFQPQGDVPSKDNSSIICSVLEHILQNSSDGTIQMLGNLDTNVQAGTIDMGDVEQLELHTYDALALPEPTPTKDAVTSLDGVVGDITISEAMGTTDLEEPGALEIDDEPVEEIHKLVFCLECNKMWKAPCAVHDTDFHHVEDTPMPTRARATLPACLSLHQTSTSQFPNQMGVWCKETVSERTKFGPVQCSKNRVGTPKCNATSFYTFCPFKVYKREQLFEVYDTESEDTSNWMIFIRLARSLLEQNCVLYQDGMDLFFVTKAEVKATEELLLWFSEELCLNYGVPQDPSTCRLVQCMECGSYVISQKKLQLHMRYSHPDQFRSQWMCIVCRKGYSSGTKLSKHMLSHVGVKTHHCLHCNKLFSDFSNLKAHQSIHTGEKNFQCIECKKRFRQKAHLNSHILIHKGVKNFKCDYCDRKFTRHSDCKTHMYSHTKERCYTCNTCNKTFHKTQNYKRHLKVHTGERNYMCDKCFKGFHTKYHRDRHLKICKEVSGKEQSYMSLEEVAKLDNTCDAPLTVKAHDVTGEHQPSTMHSHPLSDNIFT